MTAPADHMTIAEIIHDFATRQGDLTDRWAREDLAAILERRMVAERAGALHKLADEVDPNGYGWTSVRDAERFKQRLHDRADREAS